MSGQINVFNNYLPESLAETISSIVFGNSNSTSGTRGSIPFFVKIDKTSPGLISFGSIIYTNNMQYNKDDRGMQAIKTVHNIALKYLLTNSITSRCQPTDGRIFLQAPMVVEQPHKAPHINRPGNHWVVLYYINDSDGTTAFYNSDGTVRTEVEPKRNRLVIFDGTIKHSVGIPKTAPRAVLTYDMIPR